MKKSRRIKVNGEYYKYWVDYNCINEDKQVYTSVLLYHANGTITHWNPPLKMISISTPEVKNAILEGRFH